MKLKKGCLNVGRMPKPLAVYNNGIITVYYHNGSGISKKRIDLAQKTATSGASTEMYYDWAVNTPNRAVVIKGNTVAVF